MMKTWRDAASLILVTTKKLANQFFHHPEDPAQNLLARIAGGSNVLDKKRDFCVLLVKRSSRSSFMPNAFVFPGGTYQHSIDASSEFIKPTAEYAKVKPSPEAVARYFSQFSHLSHAHRPEAFSKYRKVTEFNTERTPGTVPIHLDWSSVHFPPELGFRACAIRELFEEVGVLLSFDNEHKTDRVISANINSEDPSDLSYRLNLAQAEAAHEPRAFQNSVCLAHNCSPSVFKLREWSNWLTPTTFDNAQRWDTIFYISSCPSRPLINLVPDGEIDEYLWIDPEQALLEADQGRISLPPPQVYELARLANFASIEELHSFAARREAHGCDRWMPRLITTSDDKFITVLPGDDLYYKEHELKNASQDKTQPESMAKSADELRKSTIRWHRVEFERRKPQWTRGKIYINIEPPCGHKRPIDLPPEVKEYDLEFHAAH